MRKKNSKKLNLSNLPVKNYLSWKQTGIGCWWLGQAGFLIKIHHTSIIIDAYLTNILEKKYKDSDFSHSRMMPPPITPEELKNIDYYLCSHSHSDHMDPELLPIMAKNNPNCQFIIPRASKDIAYQRGIPPQQSILVNAGDILKQPSFNLSIIPAAHEQLEQDRHGDHFFLGFLFETKKHSIYHSGDCIPYLGLHQWLKNKVIDVALLPVNGRTKQLTDQGIAGNFFFEEACDLIKELNIPHLIPHHYGMFAFNTLEPDQLKTKIHQSPLKERIFPAEINTLYHLF